MYYITISQVLMNLFLQLSQGTDTYHHLCRKDKEVTSEGTGQHNYDLNSDFPVHCLSYKIINIEKSP